MRANSTNAPPPAGSAERPAPSRAALALARCRASVAGATGWRLRGTALGMAMPEQQLATVVLQVTAKLSSFGAAVMMKGTYPTYDFAQPMLKPLYCVFVGALGVNAVVPSVLLRCERRSLQRDAVAALDIGLDLIYFYSFTYMMLFVAAHPKYLPLTPYEYLSTFWPLLHIVTVARSIETAAVQRRAEEEHQAAAATAAAGNDGQQSSSGSGGSRSSGKRATLPIWAAVAFPVIALSTIVLTFAVGGRDRYPFADWGHQCRPCKCNDDGALVSCPLAFDLKVATMVLNHIEITGIAPGAFEGFEYLKSLVLSHNNIVTLHEGSFDGLPHLNSLDLSASNTSLIELGAFRELRVLRTLVLRDSSLVVVYAGALDGLRSLHALLLDDCDQLRELEVGALPDTVQYVWLPGSALNCTRLAPQLSGGAACFDDAYCDVEWAFKVGNGYCNGGDYDTAECAWDGGDCR